MMVVGLTGGIGSGKSTVAKMFAQLNVPIYNSDHEAKLLMVSSKPLIKKIKQLFGNDAYDNKQLNRKFIADKVFTNPDLLAKLNAIVHPAVRAHFIDWVKNQEAQYVIQETAIIFENSSHEKYDKIILVTAPEEIRIQRVLERDDLTIEKIQERMANQWLDSEKIPLSDFIINNLDYKETVKKVGEIHKQLLKISLSTK